VEMKSYLDALTLGIDIFLAFLSIFVMLVIAQKLRLRWSIRSALVQTLAMELVSIPVMAIVSFKDYTYDLESHLLWLAVVYFIVFFPVQYYLSRRTN